MSEIQRLPLTAWSAEVCPCVPGREMPKTTGIGLTAPGLKLVGRRVGKVEIYHLALEGTDPQLEREDPPGRN